MTTSISSWGVNAGVHANTAKESKGSDMGQEEFLQLLITQLQNQDPLNPMEGTEFTAQLAQFSSLEQLFSIDGSLEQMLSNQTNNGAGDVASLMGKVIVAEDDSMTVNGGISTSANFTIERPANVQVTIFDSYGVEVKSINAGEMETGTYSVAWDGRDNSGYPVADGTYSYEVSATDDTGGPVPTSSIVTGEVTGVTYEYGMPYLLLGERMVSSGSILEVHMPKIAAESET